MRYLSYLSYLLNKFRRNEEHVIIENPDIPSLKKHYSSVWKDKEIPNRQMKLTKKQLPNLKKIPAIADLINLVRATGTTSPTLLEIGCSTGYHIDAFRQANLVVRYEGSDYSKYFINLAKHLHPGIPFKVRDATKLDYMNKQFDIVLSGCCILHIIDYKKAISEAARVARKYVIFHRTPTIHLQKTTFTKKIGYGLEMLEILFNEHELIDDFQRNSLVVVAVTTHGAFPVKNLKEMVYMKSYLCKKIS